MSGERRAALVVGLILIALGVLFFIGLFLDIGPYLWPFIVIAVGAGFFVAIAAGGRMLSPLAIPGSIITMVGLILLVQNTLGIWETWAYAWALIVVAVGIGVAIHGWLSRDRAAWRGGGQVILVGGGLFLAFGTFFELIVGFAWQRQGILWVGRIIWPALLILAGLFLILYWSGLLRPRPERERLGSSLWPAEPGSPEEGRDEQ